MDLSGHDFMQVHIDLRTVSVWLVPNVKNTTAETVTAARNFVSSVTVFRDVGLPDGLVFDCDTLFKFTNAFWTSLQEALAGGA